LKIALARKRRKQNENVLSCLQKLQKRAFLKAGVSLSCILCIRDPQRAIRDNQLQIIEMEIHLFPLFLKPKDLQEF
jgi:hypothetical protein